MKRTTRKGIRPKFGLAFIQQAAPREFHRVYPFRRNWIAIAVIAVFDAIFLFPAITTLQQAAAEWSRLDSLFDLTGALFLTGWLMGWSMAPLGLSTLLLLMIFGREVVRAGPEKFQLIIGLPFIGVSATYDPAGMRNLRLEQPLKKSGNAWRGKHAAFDYGANTVAFGSSVDGNDLAAIRGGLHMAMGQSVRRGEATDEELAGNWGRSRLQRQLIQKATPRAATVVEPDGKPLSLTSPSTLLLVIANLVPIYGASLLGWQLSDVMVLYWAESAVIGFFNVLKMIKVGRWFSLFGVPFFIGHFGAFMAVHFLFLYGLFVKGPGDMSPGDLDEVRQLFLGLWPGLAALFISHGFSFFRNFLGRREFAGRNMNTQMSEPYSRIVFMHLALIFGGGITMFLGEPTPVLLIVIGLKIWFDIKAHLKQRQLSANEETPD